MTKVTYGILIRESLPEYNLCWLLDTLSFDGLNKQHNKAMRKLFKQLGLR